MRITKPREDEPIRLVNLDSGARYRVVIDTAPPGAKRKQMTRTFDTIAEARTFVARTRAGLSSGTFVASTDETLEQLANRWLQSRRDVRAITVQGYGHVLAPILGRIGTRKVQSLTVADLDALTAWLSVEGGRRSKPLGPRSVRAALVALGQVLDVALQEGTVSRNVARLAKRPRVRKIAGTDLEHWQPEELRRFLAHADTDPLAAAWRLTACGMTRADVLGLRWSDVDMSTGVVTVSQGRVALDRGTGTDDPKSQARRRALPVEAMWPGTVALLRSLSARQAADRLLAGAAYRDARGLVVVDAIGEPVRPEWYSDRFRAVCAEAKVRAIRLHSVRHSLAFWLHREGVTPADAAALLGHTTEVHLSAYLPHSGASGIASAAQALAKASAAES